jgi:hypothetical protein
MQWRILDVKICCAAVHNYLDIKALIGETPCCHPLSLEMAGLSCSRRSEMQDVQIHPTNLPKE